MQSFVVILQCIVAIMCLLGDDTWIERNVAAESARMAFIKPMLRILETLSVR